MSASAADRRLFVYGTLAPGRANARVLAPLGGRWRPAAVRGVLRPEGWGAALGFPGLVLDASAPPVDGLLFEAAGLAERWEALDRFEGEGYRRVVAEVRLADGARTEANVYVLAEAPQRR